MEPDFYDGSTLEIDAVPKPALYQQRYQSEQHHAARYGQEKLPFPQPVDLNIFEQFDHPTLPIDTAVSAIVPFIWSLDTDRLCAFLPCEHPLKQGPGHE